MLPFVVLCTMNSATYRYGASDQAFYIPAVVLAMHPDYFPRDAPVIRAQATLTLADDAMGRLSSVTGIGLPLLSFGLYAGSLLLLATAAWLVASRLYRTHWAALALLAALTLRHSISRTGTNTLEGYFHPRQLAFGLGALGVAFLLRRRISAAAVAVLLAGAIHPTTALWFGIWLAVAVAINAGVCLLVFKVATARDVTYRQVLPGAVAAATVWQLLQWFGAVYVGHVIKSASATNSVFALVLGLLAFLYLIATTLLLCAQVNVVAADRLYPRALLTPFTDDVELTRGDRETYTGQAKAQRAKGFQHIDVTFDGKEPDDPQA